MISIADALRNEGVEKGIKKGWVLGHREGRQEGHQEGLQEGQVAIIKKMLLAGMPKNQVASIAGLSLEEVDIIALPLAGEASAS